MSARLFRYSVALLLAATAAVPSAQAQSPFQEEEIRIPVDPEVTLAGTLVVPEGQGPFPAVVLLSTALAEDRDASRAGFRPLRVLAENLALAGVASIRWDDRGMGESTGRHVHEYPIDDLVRDGLKAIEFLKDRPDIDPKGIGVSGISLGGMLSVVIAAHSEDVAFIIPLAGPVPDLRHVNVRYRRRVLEAGNRPPEEVEDLLELEARAVEATLTGEGKAELAADMRAAVRRDWQRLPPDARARYQDFDDYFARSWYGLYLQVVETPFLRSLYELDMESTIERVSCPAYFIYGGADLQIVASEAAPMIGSGMAAAGNDHWAIRVFPDAGHYITKPWGTFAPGLLESMTSWIFEHVPASSRLPPRAHVETSIDEAVAAAMTAGRIPGLAIGVVRGDSVLFVKGYGVQAVGSREPVQPTTRFEIGSLTKPITGTAVAVLVSDGVLDWDDPVGRHLPGFSTADPLVRERLTVRDLLAMRSGFSEDVSYGSASDGALGILEAVSALKAPGFRTRGGSTANLNVFLAGQVIEAASSEPWEEFVQKRLFVPLGMTRTGVRAMKGGPDRASGHALSGGTLRPVARTDIGPLVSAGGLESTVADLANWLRFLLSEGSASEPAILSPEALRETWRPQALGPTSWIERFNTDARLMAVGLPWILSEFRGATLVEAAGLTSGFTGILAFVPDHDVGIVALTNVRGALIPLRDLKHRILDLILQEAGRDSGE